MNRIKEKGSGILVCLVIAIPAWLLGKYFPIVGGAVIAIIAGMLISLVWTEKGTKQNGIQFTSKYILQTAVVLLGFGMDLNVVLQTGKESLPIILSTITVSLLIAYGLKHVLHIPSKIATLVGVGSSICGGSAIAATAPVIEADDTDVAQAISVIFFFNVLAALFFPSLGHLLGFSTTNGHAFGIFAGTAINDTSSVTAAATTWDGMWGLKTATLDQAVTVKLTRTLAIIPITLFLAVHRSKQTRTNRQIQLKNIFPFFIVYFVLASMITTILIHIGVPAAVFGPIKELSKFFIVMAMAAIGLNSNLIRLIRSGGKPILLGASCWVGITGISLLIQRILGIW